MTGLLLSMTLIAASVFFSVAERKNQPALQAIG
jgi:hypothetical protein